MVKIIEKENLIKIGREPVVILSLKKWREFEESLEDLEDAARFHLAYKETRGQKLIGLEGLKKRYKLK